MMSTTVFLIQILILCSVPGIFSEDIIVEIAQGKLSGSQETAIVSGTPFYSFKGIPYAKPPVGELRFKAPVEADSWEGVRDATVHGNVCPQFNPITAVYTPGSEDCLFLNVYSPNLNGSLPVIVWIHGGAFLFGSGNDDLYGPDFLISKDVVVVSFNYRLEALGFLCLDTEDVPGNAALKDQVLALKWVQQNIAKFGGNPKEVTVMGGTAGGASVAYHIISPLSKGLFKRAISSSGAPACDCLYPYEPKKRAFQLGKLLRPNQTEIKDTEELLTFLQSVPYDQLVNVQPRILTSESVSNVLLKLQYFTPVVEKDFGKNKNFITKDPYDSLKGQNFNDVDVMFSYSSGEATLLTELLETSYIDLYNTYREMFVPSKWIVSLEPEVNLELADLIVDFYFGNKSIITTEVIPEFIHYDSIVGLAYDIQAFFRQVSDRLGTYFFKFSYFSSRNQYGQAGLKYGLRYASHFDIEFYLFNPKSLNLTLEENTEEYTMVQNITTAVTNFAKYGEPSPSGSLGVDWPKFTKKSLAYVNFGTTLESSKGADEKDMKFWQGLYDHVKKIKGLSSGWRSVLSFFERFW
ncbi:esterase B1-like [Trichoplusia ni]|uniref:Esterase B1-like n=1 Tax=Trichoplusia ni TaxID=7111 RepID=A0A7E5WUK9_TRINI|nr:esterase B1-like [Trichoplusia ni]